MGNSMSRSRQAGAPAPEPSDAIRDTWQQSDETMVEYQEVPNVDPIASNAQQSTNNYSESSPPLHPVKTHGESDKRPKDTVYDADMLCLKDRGLMNYAMTLECIATCSSLMSLPINWQTCQIPSVT